VARDWPALPVFQSAADLPELPKGWKACQAQDLYEPLDAGRRYDQKTVLPMGRVPVLQQQAAGYIGFHNDEPGVRASEEDPVVTFANHTCEMRLMTSPFSAIQNVFSMRGIRGVCTSRFLYYGTKGRIRLSEYRGHHPDYRRMWIGLPPLAEQRAIAEVLGALDDKIEANSQVHRLSWQLAASFFDRLIDRSPREIPLGSVADLAYGKGLPARARVEGNVPVYGSGGLTGWHDEALVSGPGVIVGRKGTVGEVHWSQGPFYPIDTTFYVQPIRDLPKLFLYFVLRSLGLHGMNSDSAVPGLNRHALLAREIPLPEAVPLRNFVDLAMPLVDCAQAVQHESKALTRLRDVLLPRLLSGELRVRDAEALVEGAV